MKSLIDLNRRSIIVLGFLFAIICISDSCKKSSDTQLTPGTNEVFIQGTAFNPSTITVAVGTTITWTNKDGVDHTVTSNTGLFESGHISNNGTFSHLFSTAGTFAYHCSIHTTMTASVIVN